MISRYDVEQSFARYNKEDINIIFDAIETCTNKGDYILQYWGGTVLIYDISTDLYLTWVDITHIGQCITTNITNTSALNEILDDLLYYCKGE